MAFGNGKPPAWYLNKMFKKTRKEELYAWLDPSGIYADRDVSFSIDSEGNCTLDIESVSPVVEMI